MSLNLSRQDVINTMRTNFINPRAADSVIVLAILLAVDAEPGNDADYGQLAALVSRVVMDINHGQVNQK
ncbi:hypothetical protein [Serratia silvae]|uniref:Uncharacterized protein n=1 Tax=Serratia silvae TaxID=2824122 RepID=A0ABT0KH50_9GAMM|nr:hypothetical protein [Serratia silvae]MCL1031361.1 hypothetical protein [Serratia silvae]